MVAKGGGGGRRGIDGVISGRAWMEQVGDEGRQEAWPKGDFGGRGRAGTRPGHTVVLGAMGWGKGNALQLGLERVLVLRS